MDVKNSELLKDQTGSFSYFMVFVLLAVMLVFLFAIGIPLLMAVNSEFYAAGEPLLDRATASANEVENAEVQAAMLSNIEAQRNSIPDQMEVLGVFFQYGWLIIIVVIVLILFMASRRTIESGGLA